MTRSKCVLLALVALLPGALAGCGEKDESLGSKQARPMSLLLDYFPNADHAGIYAAQAGGHFGNAGLKVSIRQPADPAAPIKQVAAGRVDLAVSYEPEVLRARDEGLDVVSVAALVREPLTSIISLPSAGIRSPKDLKGKTVGTAGIDYQTSYLHTILAEAGVDPSTVKERNVGFSLTPALLTGKVDAVLGAFWNYEGVELELKHRRPRIIRMNGAGVPTYDELVLVANGKALAHNGDKIRAFIGAIGRGTEDLSQNPAKGIKGLLAANPDLDPRLQRESVKVTLPYFLPQKGKPYGYQSPQAWQKFAAWMQENKIVTKTPDATGAFTNKFLPGSGL
jgi:putative hydroxymethylpyrimidine transport system substrate-binding protein